jgi:hypothetical protein
MHWKKVTAVAKIKAKAEANAGNATVKQITK